MIVWDDSLSTGVAEIDVQHQRLIDKYNELEAALDAGNGEGRLVAGELLDFLQFYVVWHFEREEVCMHEWQCPIAAVNQKAHAEFVAMFGEFYERWQTGSMSTALALETFGELGRWIENHIRGIDSGMRGCMP